MGFIEWRIDGLSGNIDEDFEQFNDDSLQIIGSYTLSSSDQYIVSKISVDINFRKLLLNWCIFIIGGRIWWLNYVVAFRYEDDDLVPTRMNVMFFSCRLIINNYTGIRYRNFNINHFVLTQKCNPFILFNRNWRLSINFILTDKTTCSHYRLKHT